MFLVLRSTKLKVSKQSELFEAKEANAAGTHSYHIIAKNVMVGNGKNADFVIIAQI